MQADPIERDEQVLTDQEDEAGREQRWAEFVLAVYRWGADRVLARVVALREERDQRDELDALVLSFQETEGWPGVLVAIARAIREAEA
jgi:hypothetical protein